MLWNADLHWQYTDLGAHMTHVFRSALAGAAVTVVSALALTGCATEVPTSTTTILAADEILTSDLASGVTAQGVLLAAVLLVAGDVEAALDKGIVTSAEVNTAQLAVDEGTLDVWRQRAEMDAK
jgi:hypothetical protein